MYMTHVNSIKYIYRTHSTHRSTMGKPNTVAVLSTENKKLKKRVEMLKRRLNKNVEKHTNALSEIKKILIPVTTYLLMDICRVLSKTTIAHNLLATVAQLI